MHARICTADRQRRLYVSWRVENRGDFSVPLAFHRERHKTRYDINLSKIGYVFYVCSKNPRLKNL